MIEDFEGVDGHSGGQRSLNKDKRWEVVEQLKHDPQYVVIERDVKDTHQQRLVADAKVEAVRKRFLGAPNGGGRVETLEQPVVGDEERFKKEYRFTKGRKGTTGGVMISRKRQPGKKGVRKQAKSAPVSSSSGSDSDSDLNPDKRFGYVVVERHDKKTQHDYRYLGNGKCNCDLCRPEKPHYDRSDQRKKMEDALRFL